MHLQPHFLLFVQVVNESSYIWDNDPQRGDRQELLDLLITTNCYLPLDTMSVPFWRCLGTSLQLLKQVLTIAARTNPTPEVAKERLEWVAKGACSRGSVEVLDHVLDVANAEGLFLDEKPLFIMALTHGHRKVAELLYTRSGSDISRFFGSEDPEHERLEEPLAPQLALAYAADCGSRLLTDALLALDVDVNAVHGQFRGHIVPAWTTLSKAADADIVEVLLAAGADVNPESCDTVLRGACEKLQHSVVKMLLDAKADVNRIGKSDPALFYAVFAECKNIDDKITTINLLFDSGASARDAVDGKSILHKHGRVTQMKAFQRDVSPVLHLLLARDPGMLECRDHMGQTPLMAMVAASRKYPWLIRALLDAGVDVRAVDRRGFSALFHLFTKGIAAYSGDAEVREILQMLLQAGADPTICGVEGETLLMRAVEPPGSDRVRTRVMGLPKHSVSDLACSVFIGDILDSIIDAGAE
jgi:ankyrin repeat protein